MFQTTDVALARLSSPRLSARVSAAESASLLARLIASGAAVTRADLVRETGLARSTVATGLSALESIGLLAPDGQLVTAGRGRPGERIRISPDFGIVATLEVDTVATRVALWNFGQELLASFTVAAPIGLGPEQLIADVSHEITDRLASLAPNSTVRMAVVGVSAPVDVRSGSIAGPPLLEGWEQFPFETRFGAVLGCPVVLRNDSDLRALGEARSLLASESPLLYVRIASGVGAGFTDAGSELLSGVDGAAGEISHMKSVVRDGITCACGGLDHIADYASETAMLGRWRLSRSDRVSDDAEMFERRLAQRDLDALRIATEAARVLGAALVDVLLMLNPARITVGGSIVDASDAILATIRGVIYENGLPLATRNLTISASVIGEGAGLRGGLVLALEQSLSANRIAAYLQAPDA